MSSALFLVIRSIPDICSRRSRAAPWSGTFRLAGWILTSFSSLVARVASSSQATAVLTRVSSLTVSRWKSPSVSSARISPGVATMSVFCFVLSSSLLSALRTLSISCLLIRERAFRENCCSVSSGV